VRARAGELDLPRFAQVMEALSTLTGMELSHFLGIVKGTWRTQVCAQTPGVERLSGPGVRWLAARAHRAVARAPARPR
jgi:hypothetical protein